ncbi:MmgE/PrpD family protein [Natronomonas gomsonensis]|uniref:MmgE/PrpD family protein n=1 Tax=Natronomonas gomsonensis TaxID=1046043 RepID=UPI0020CA5E85|nr:MmgE/PrpD family protein [Natronomonas gomsonensis]MCY4729946.1 MmgE/PrpD family protein [Natronomonas gomsonensis]
MTHTIDASLAGFVAGATGPDIPDEARRIAERAFVDTVGVTLPGIVDPAGRTTRAVFASKCGGPASVLGTTDATSVADAALVNGTAGHALDYDDVTWGVWHPSVTLVAPILAVAEREGASGMDAITAFAVGFETQCYLAEALLPGHYERGWHATATFGTIGSAAAAVSLLNLDETATRHALNVAASMPAGLKYNFGTMTKPLHSGLAARSGVTAALLAAEGFTGADGALGTDRGFCDLYSDNDGPSDVDPATLGDPWALVEYGLQVKKYPCCYFTHPGIAATQHLVATHDIKPADIEQIIVTASRGAADALHYSDPSTGLEAKFSMQYVIASAVARDRVGLAAFEDDAINNPAVQAVRERVDFEVDPELAYNPYQTMVSIETTASDRYSHTQDRPPGTPENPLSDAELRAKFDAVAAHAPDGIDADRAYDLLDDLRAVEDVQTLVKTLRSV